MIELKNNRDVSLKELKESLKFQFPKMKFEEIKSFSRDKIFSMFIIHILTRAIFILDTEQ